MKTKVILLIFLAVAATAQAQFFKKLKNRVVKSAENTVIRKAENKTARETDQTIDKVFEPNGNTERPASVDLAQLPDRYDFSWKYTLQMTSKGDNFNMHYFLKENASYFGSQAEAHGGNSANDMFMVFDPTQNTTTIFSEYSGEKRGQVISMPAETFETPGDNEEYTFKEIGTKVILGHNCQGFEIENTQYKMTTYVYLDSPVSLNNMINNSKFRPKGMDPKWLEKTGNGLMMEMNFVDKKKSKKNMKIQCVALQQETKSINLSEYMF